MNVTVETNVGKFEFCEEPHGYFLDGKKLDNTTSIMDAAGITEYSKVDPAILEPARMKGQAVHLAVEWLEKGIAHEPLHPVVQAHVDQYLRFKVDTGFRPKLIEEPMLCWSYTFGTKIDLIGIYFDSWVIMEIKTSALSTKHANIQTAAQLMAFQSMKNLGFYGEIPQNLHRYSLELSEESYKVRGPFVRDSIDSAVFTSALWVARYKRGDYNE